MAEFKDPAVSVCFKVKIDEFPLGLFGLLPRQALRRFPRLGFQFGVRPQDDFRAGLGEPFFPPLARERVTGGGRRRIPP